MLRDINERRAEARLLQHHVLLRNVRQAAGEVHVQRGHRGTAQEDDVREAAPIRCEQKS
jgi:hypothetical protein